MTPVFSDCRSQLANLVLENARRWFRRTSSISTVEVRGRAHRVIGAPISSASPFMEKWRPGGKPPGRETPRFSFGLIAMADRRRIARVFHDLGEFAGAQACGGWPGA